MRIPGCRPEPRRSGGSLVLDAPNGQIKLDQNHQGISTSFVTEVIKDKNDDLVNHLRRFERGPATSALPPIPDISLQCTETYIARFVLLSGPNGALAERRSLCSRPALLPR